MVRKIPPFRCSKVLPLVYDESLSYYEAICKITEKINDLIDYVETYVLPSVDTEMSDTSENPVQNKVIKEYVDSQSGAIVDSEMSSTSENAVQNKVIKEYVDNSIPSITVDSEISSTSENPVQNKVIKEYVDNNVPSITVDIAMSSTSENPVQNKVIKAYVDSKTNEMRNITAGNNTVYTIAAGNSQTIENFMTLPSGLYAVCVGFVMDKTNSLEDDYKCRARFKQSGTSNYVNFSSNGLNANLENTNLQLLNTLNPITLDLIYSNGGSVSTKFRSCFVNAIRLGDFVVPEESE